MSIFLGELIGTAILMLLGNGVVANVLLSKSKGQNSGWIVISAGWAFAVAIAVYATGWISGGHINPAVTIGFAIIGKTDWSLVPTYILGQLLGAMIGSTLVWLSYMPHWKVTQDIHLKLSCFSTRPAIKNKVTNFITEVVATAVLLLGVLSILDSHNQVIMGFLPYAVGILIFSIGLSLGGPTGFAINPARDLGPRIMHQILPIAGKGTSEWEYALIPIIGPIVGAAIGALIYAQWIAPMLSLYEGLRV
jgi:glycerol uptake facilitator protein